MVATQKTWYTGLLTDAPSGYSVTYRIAYWSWGTTPTLTVYWSLCNCVYYYYYFTPHIVAHFCRCCSPQLLIGDGSIQLLRIW